MNFWQMTVVKTCARCGGSLEKKGNQTGVWLECSKCGRIVDIGDIDKK